MAGEWIPYDVCLPQKPEVLELVDRTGLAPDQVVGRLLMLWGWAALNSSDGTARMSLRLLGRLDLLGLGASAPARHRPRPCAAHGRRALRRRRRVQR